MAKKSKPTREFSPMAKRIYKMVQKAVNARTEGLCVLRAIDKEIDRIKVGSPDPQLVKEINDLKGQVNDQDKVLKDQVGVVKEMEEKHKSELADEVKAGEILSTANSQLTADLDQAKAVGVECEGQFKKLEEEFQKVSSSNDDRGLEIIKLQEQIAGEPPAGSDPADTKKDTADKPPEKPEKPADPE